MFSLKGVSVLALVVMVGGQARSFVAPGHVLDLVASPEVPIDGAPEALSVPGGLLPSPSSDAQLPLEVTLVAVDPQQVRGGDRVVYEVLLENVGRVPVVLPWSSTNKGMTQRMKGARVAAVSIVPVVRPGEPVFPVVVQILFGVDEVDGSLVTLRPGESARIRTSGYLNLQQPTAAGVIPGGPLRVGAQLTLYGAMGSSTIVSSNETTVFVQR